MKTRIFSMIAAFSLGAAAALFAQTPAAPEAAADNSAAPPASAEEAAHQKAAELMAQAEARFNRAKSYRCVMHMTVTEDGDVETQTQKYWFRRPGLFRTEQIGDFRNGAIAVKNAEGKIRAKLGGLLGAVPIPITESMAAGITGDTISNSSYREMFTGFHGAEKKGVRHGYSEQGSRAMITSTPQDGGKIVTITIDPRTRTILKVEHRYPSGDGFSVEWRDVVWDEDMPDSLFDF